MTPSGGYLQSITLCLPVQTSSTVLLRIFVVFWRFLSDAMQLLGYFFFQVNDFMIFQSLEMSQSLLQCKF